MSGPFKSLIKETAIYGVSSIFGRFLNYLLVPLYTAVFTDPSDYGVVSELYAWVAFLLVLLTFGMETAYFRFLQESEDKQKTFRNALWSVTIVSTLFALSVFLFFQEIADALLFGEHPEYIVLLSVIVLVDAMSALPLAKLRAEKKAFKFAGIQLSSIAVNIFLNLGLMLFLFDASRPDEGVIFILLANLCASFIKPLFFKQDFSQLLRLPDVAGLKSMILYAAPLVLAGFAGIINEMLDRIMLKQMLFDSGSVGSLHYAESQVGIYSASYKLAMLITIFIQAYRYAAEPFFFNQYTNENKNQIYVKVMNVFVAVVAFFFLGVSVNLDVLKYFIQNESYWEGLQIVPVLLLANVFLGIYINQSIWYKLSNQTQFGLYIALVGAAITIAGNYVLIPTYGYVACAWVTMFVYGIQMALSYFLGQLYYPIPYNLKRIFLYIGVSVAIFFVVGYLPKGNFVIQMVLGNLFILLFAAVVFRLEFRQSLGGLLRNENKQ